MLASAGVTRTCLRRPALVALPLLLCVLGSCALEPQVSEPQQDPGITLLQETAAAGDEAFDGGADASSEDKAAEDDEDVDDEKAEDEDEDAEDEDDEDEEDEGEEKESQAEEGESDEADTETADAAQDGKEDASALQAHLLRVRAEAQEDGEGDAEEGEDEEGEEGEAEEDESDVGEEGDEADADGEGDEESEGEDGEEGDEDEEGEVDEDEGEETRATSGGIDKSGCVWQVVVGLDNLLGVCEAQANIAKCAAAEGPVGHACKEVKGPGGALITQDISEDVTLGQNTPALTRKWHEAFTACAQQSSKEGCQKASSEMSGPILAEVQRGLAQKISACEQTKSVALKEEEFTGCQDGVYPGAPKVTPKLREILMQHVVPLASQEQLKRFPLNGLVQWADSQQKA